MISLGSTEDTPSQPIPFTRTSIVTAPKTIDVIAKAINNTNNFFIIILLP
jgi:hypothetical protein